MPPKSPNKNVSPLTVNSKMVLRLANVLFRSAKQDFFGYVSVGAVTAALFRLMPNLGFLSELSPWVTFVKDLTGNLSSLSSHILFATIFWVCLGMFMRGVCKTATWLERYLLHPLIALASDTTASAVGFFLVAATVDLFTKPLSGLRVSLEGLGYYGLASLLFWVGRAIAFEHGNKQIWGTRSNPKFNRFPLMLKAVGGGGALASGLVIFLR